MIKGFPFKGQKMDWWWHQDEYSSFTNDWLAGLDTVGCAHPSDAFLADLDEMLVGLNSDGVLIQFDRLHIFATELSCQSTVSVINPAASAAAPMLLVNSPTFTANQGFTGNGVDMYMDLQFKPSDGVKYLQNNAAFGVYVTTNVIEDTYDMGANDGSIFCEMTTKGSLEIFSGKINDNHVPMGSIVPAGDIGMFEIRRPTSNRNDYNLDGAFLAQDLASVSGARPAQNFYVMCRNNNGAAGGFSTRRYAMCYIASRNVTAQVATRFQTFATARGFNV